MPAACAAELPAELAALGPVEGSAPPAVEELYELVPDLECGPPGAAGASVDDLPAELLAEYLAITEDLQPGGPMVAGRPSWPAGDGWGFAAGQAPDDLPPGTALAGLVSDAWAAGLGRLGDDELVGVLLATRRLASWSAALELEAVAELAARREAEAAMAGDWAPGEHISD